jgi:hypothetical protein
MTDCLCRSPKAADSAMHGALWVAAGEWPSRRSSFPQLLSSRREPAYGVAGPPAAGRCVGSSSTELIAQQMAIDCSARRGTASARTNIGLPFLRFACVRRRNSHAPRNAEASCFLALGNAAARPFCSSGSELFLLLRWTRVNGFKEFVAT